MVRPPGSAAVALVVMAAIRESWWAVGYLLLFGLGTVAGMMTLTTLLALNPNVKIYAPKEGFGVFGSDLPSAFYRKDDSVPAEQRYYDGKPPEIMRFGTAWPASAVYSHGGWKPSIPSG